MAGRSVNRKELLSAVQECISCGGSVHAVKRAAVMAGCSCRTITRAIRKYEEKGPDGLEHGNRGRKPATAIDEKLREQIVQLYISEYSDATFRHFSEIVEVLFGIHVSDMTIQRWMREKYWYSPASHKATKRRLEKLHKERMKADAAGEVKDRSEQEDLVMAPPTIDRKSAHPHRPRSCYFGEMIQMDASQYRWNGKTVWHLHLAIDDATSEVVGAWFDTQETLDGYYHVFSMIMHRYGIPAMFYTDRRTIFEYRKTGEDKLEKDTFTQFAYACKTLGCQIRVTSQSQAKGRIERANRSFQQRLPIELRMRGIEKIEDANAFLPEFLDSYNRKFSALTQDDIEKRNVFADCPSEEKINTTLAVLATRTVDPGHCIRYDNRYYMPLDEKGEPVYLEKGIKVLAIKSFDGNMYLNIKDSLYALGEVEPRLQKSREFDFDAPVQEKKKKKYIPPLDHPWRMKNFSNWVEKQKKEDGEAE